MEKLIWEMHWMECLSSQSDEKHEGENCNFWHFNDKNAIDNLLKNKNKIIKLLINLSCCL